MSRSWRTRVSGWRGRGRRWLAPLPGGTSLRLAASISCGSAGARMRRRLFKLLECWTAKGGRLPKAPIPPA
eukprot:14541944-Alexandrium_andersonii.AAC.1